MNDVERNINTKLLLCKVVVYIGIINFAVFFITALSLGGDAVNGTIYHGRYYLMAHGKYTEVNKAVFDYSKWHVHSLFVTHPLAMFASYWYLRIKKQAGCRADQS